MAHLSDRLTDEHELTGVDIDPFKPG